MAHRVIRDQSGVSWDVWEVFPSAVERRAAQARIRANAGADRRTAGGTDFRVVVPAKLQRGWLAFQARTQKRRLSPVPDGWEGFTDEALLELLARAESVGKPKRLIE